MSLLTDNISLSSSSSAIKPPSLVYPSLVLPRNEHIQHRRRRRSIIDNNDDEYSSSQNEMNHSIVVGSSRINSKDLQTCIHFASRLIKLRSELRSPSYMRTSTSLQMLNNASYDHYFQQQQQQLQQQQQAPPSIYSTTTNTNSLPLSEVGRIHSLPNVSQFNHTLIEDTPHPYLRKLNFSEDESEIMSLNSSTTTDEASQLTYLTELIRRRQKNMGSTARKESYAAYHLSLPPKHQLLVDSTTAEEKRSKRLSLTPSYRRPRSAVSLRDMIYEAVDEAMNSNLLNQPIIKRERYSSLALASQLLYASQSEKEKEQEQEEEKHSSSSSSSSNYKGKTEISEEEASKEEEKKNKACFVIDKEERHLTSLNIIAQEKVEIPPPEATIATTASKFISSLKRQDDNKKKISTTTITPANIIDNNSLAATVPKPKPSQSRDTNKSLFSTLSSDSESEEESSSSNPSSSILFSSKRKTNKRRPTAAFLVSISPSSAAAATVAKSRRNNKRQVIRTKLVEVYSAATSSNKQ